MGCVNTKGTMKLNTGRSRKPKEANKPMAQPISRESYYARRSGRLHATARRTDDPPTAPTAEDAKTDLERAVLKVLDVDFNIAENSVNHHTDSYEITQDQEPEGDSTPTRHLVVRRGESFDITLKFDRAFDADKDDLKLVFDAGCEPRESRGTRVVMILSDEDHPKEWGAKTVSKEDGAITVRIFTPPNCYVAKWNFKLDTIIKKEKTEEDPEPGSKVFRYAHVNPIYIIFNPWCPDDAVYLDDEDMRQEYVMNDTGMIYRGSSKQISAKPWNFGQFEDFMLDCCFYLLDQSGLSWRMRGRPIDISRKISALANAPDDNGVLVGNWSGDYTGGKSPLDWVGSVAIMEQFWKSKEPVQFGQCWVFSGIVTTIGRCLGIPTRSVTNFASAHDTDGSITIDSHWSTDGEPMEEFNQDSVWNFHVWNEAWMSRPDLPSGYGGWQAIDATPQETSDGVYCAGPASVEAMKNGLVNLLYDGAFIFAEVNADRIHWIQKAEGGWRQNKQTSSVGKYISTKTPNGFSRLDVTGLYKYPEGSQQERTSVWRAAKEGSTRHDVYKNEEEDMFFDLIEKDDAMFGEGFSVTVKARNEGKEDRTVSVTLTARSVFYTGVPAAVIKKETYTVTAPTGAAGEISMNVDYSEYGDKIVDMCGIKISLMASVTSTGQVHCESDDFRLLKPDVDIKAPEEVAVGEEYDVELSFKNPLPKVLNKCQFTLEGAGLQKGGLVVKQNNVEANGDVNATVKLRAKRQGTRYLSVSFRSEEICDVTGQTTIKVVPAPPKPVKEETPQDETEAEEKKPGENNQQNTETADDTKPAGEETPAEDPPAAAE